MSKFVTIFWLCFQIFFLQSCTSHICHALHDWKDVNSEINGLYWLFEYFFRFAKLCLQIISVNRAFICCVGQIQIVDGYGTLFVQYWITEKRNGNFNFQWNPNCCGNFVFPAIINFRKQRLLIAYVLPWIAFV